MLLEISKDYPPLGGFSHFALRDADGGDWRQNRIELTATIGEPCPERIEVLKCDFGTAPEEAHDWQWERDTKGVKVLDGGGPAIHLIALNSHGAAIHLPDLPQGISQGPGLGHGYEYHYWADSWGPELTLHPNDAKGVVTETQPATSTQGQGGTCNPGILCLRTGLLHERGDPRNNKFLQSGDFVTVQIREIGNEVTSRNSTVATLRFRILSKSEALSCSDDVKPVYWRD